MSDLKAHACAACGCSPETEAALQAAREAAEAERDGAAHLVRVAAQKLETAARLVEQIMLEGWWEADCDSCGRSSWPDQAKIAELVSAALTTATQTAEREKDCCNVEEHFEARAGLENRLATALTRVAALEGALTEVACCRFGQCSCREVAVAALARAAGGA